MEEIRGPPIGKTIKIKHHDSGKFVGTRPEECRDVVQIEGYVGSWDEHWRLEEADFFHIIRNTTTGGVMVGDNWDGAYRVRLCPSATSDKKHLWRFDYVRTEDGTEIYRIINENLKKMLFCDPSRANNIMLEDLDYHPDTNWCKWKFLPVE